MRFRQVRLVQEAKREPACVEGRLHATAIARRARRRDNLIGEVGRAPVEQSPRQIPPLVPPDVRVARQLRIRLALDKEPRRLKMLAGAAELSDPGDQVERVVEEFRRDGAQQAAAVGLSIEHGDHGAGELGAARPEQLRLRLRLAAAAVQHEPAEPIKMIVARQLAAEARDDRGGLVLRQVLLAPEGADDSPGHLIAAGFPQRSRIGEAAARGEARL
jgi:hypothetical protein